MKWLKRVLLVGVAFFVISGIFMYYNAKMIEPPSREDAPGAIQFYYIEKDGREIPTVYYYFESLEKVDGQVVMNGYWIEKDGRYIKKNKERPISGNYWVIWR